MNAELIPEAEPTVRPLNEVLEEWNTQQLANRLAPPSNFFVLFDTSEILHLQFKHSLPPYEKPIFMVRVLDGFIRTEQGWQHGYVDNEKIHHNSCFPLNRNSIAYFSLSLEELKKA